MRKNFILMMLLSIIVYSNAQSSQDTCGTPEADSAFLTTLPWFGNNTFLTNFRDSLHNANSCNNCRVGYEGGVGNYIYQVPVRVIIFYDATHRALDDNEIQWYINEVNRLYHQSGLRVHLYLDCAVYREYNTIKAASNWADMWAASMSTERLTNRLNIALVHSDAGVNTANGIGPYPWLQDKYGSAISADGTNPFTNTGLAQLIATTIAHEVGHTLGLLHTFHKNTHNRTNCFQECVSRTRTQEGYCFFTAGKKKCSVNGDCLCDTDADVEDLDDNLFSSCFFHTYDVSPTNTFSNSRKFDNYGDQWYQPGFTNAMDNLMSYWACAELLTPMQQGVFYHYLNKTNSSMKYNVDVDFYENDNYYQPNVFNIPNSNQNIFSVNTKQYHTFHHNFNPTTACDVDWVYFQLPNNTIKPYVIQTQEVIGKPKPDTKITLFAINSDGTLGVQVATHDNNSTTDLFSKITANLPNATGINRYAIRIENNITNTADARSKGHYFLRVDECFDKTNVDIVGDATICTSKPYSVSSLSTGASVIWSVIPAGAVTFTNTGNSTVATKATNGNATIKATITMCGVSYELTKVVGLGLPYTLYPVNGSLYQEAIMETDLGEGPCNTQCYSPGGPNINWSAPEAYNATSTTWQKTLSLPANYNFWSASNNTVSLFFKVANQSVELRRTLTNVCGSVQQYYCFGSNTTLCPAPMMMTSTVNQTLKVYPNPTLTGSTITLELFVEEQQIDFENATIQLIDKSNIILFEKVGKKILKEKLDIQSVSSGTYYVTVTNSNGSVSQELIVNSGQ